MNRFPLRSPQRGSGRAVVCLAWLAATSAGSVLSGASYDLEIVAHSPNFPDDPTATQRQFGIPHVNNLGQVMFKATWIDNGGTRHNTLRLSRGGSTTPVAESGQAVDGYPELAFENADDSGGREINYLDYTSNANGQVLFNGNVAPKPPNTGPLSFHTAVWKGTPGTYGLIAGGRALASPALPPAADVAGVDYSGPGTVQFASVGTGLVLADNGKGLFQGTLEAAVPMGNTYTFDPITSGIITLGVTNRRLLAYPHGPAPGLIGAYEFASFGAVGFGRANGGFAQETTVTPFGGIDPTNLTQVFYEFRDDVYQPFYTLGDPLPDLPPLADVLGTTEPYDLRANLVAVDETGNAVLFVWASAKNIIDVRPIGYWKHTADGLAKVLMFNEDYPTADGVLHLLPTSNSFPQNVAMGGGKLAYFGSFTGGAFTTPTPGIIREIDGGLDLVAAAGMFVNSGVTRLNNDFLSVNVPIRMNAAGEVAFVASGRDSSVDPYRRALWVLTRDEVVRRVCYLTQRISINDVDYTISNFTANSDDQALNDAGVVAATLFFTDLSSAVIRGVPPGYTDPPLPGRDFWFNGAKGNNWHTSGGTPPTNWEDQDGTPRAELPGDVDVNFSSVFIPQEFSVVLDQRAAPVGSLQVDGALTMSQPLTLNYPSVLQTVTVTGPSGAINANHTTVRATTTTWNSGTLSLFDSTFRNDGTFTARTGMVAHVDGTTAFENAGEFHKEGSGDFVVDVPFHASRSKPSDGNPDLSVAGGTLALQGGGTLTGPLDIGIATGSLLRLEGTVAATGFETIHGLNGDSDAGSLELGAPDHAIELSMTAGSALILQLPGHTTTFHGGALRGTSSTCTNTGTFVWKGGTIGFVGSSAQGFSNAGALTIAPDNQVRRIEGYFRNNTGALVEQSGDLQVTGEVENVGLWQVDQACTISDAGATQPFVNRGIFSVDLTAPGTVTVSAPFANSHLLEPDGELVTVGTAPGSAASSLVFTGTVQEVSNNELHLGAWHVGSAGTLTFPQDIKVLFETELWIAGSVPSLKLREIGASRLTFSGTSYATPAELANFGAGVLIIEDSSTLTVTGSLLNQGRIECYVGSKIIVGTDFTHGSNASLLNFGEISVGGSLLLSGDVKGNGKFIVPSSSVLEYAGEVVPGASPGKMSVEGAAFLATTATLNMEVAGTGADQYDILSVTGNAEVGGTLLVALLDGFVPAAGDTFPLVQAGSISGAFTNVASGARLSVTDGSGSFAVHYGAGSAHDPAQVVLADWQPAVAGSPSISMQPVAQTIAAGGSFTLTVSATGTGPLHYQWRYHGADIVGATGDSYIVPSSQAFHAGSYSVVVSNDAGTVYSSSAAITIEDAPAADSRLLNLSTRAETLTGDNILIPGFVVSGTGTKQLLIRAVGPTLTHDPYNIATALDNPKMALKRLDFSVNPPVYLDIAENDDWQTNANAAAISQAISDLFAFPFEDDREAALLVDLAPGQYTVFADGVANATGVAIVELYDADAATVDARLINISNRGFVGTGDNVMIPGFVVSSEGPKTLLIRVVGPTLAGAPYNVPGTMIDPKLQLFRKEISGSDTLLLTQDNWGDNPDAANTAQTAIDVSAFALATGSADAAFVVTLPPGVYTVIGSAANGTSTGVVLVEIYVVP